MFPAFATVRPTFSNGESWYDAIQASVRVRPMFYSRYFALVNIGSLLLQLFLVSRIVKYAGVDKAVTLQPAVAVLGDAVLGFVPVLGLMLAAKISEKATDYSSNNTVRNMLFSPSTREKSTARSR